MANGLKHNQIALIRWQLKLTEQQIRELPFKEAWAAYKEASRIYNEKKKSDTKEIR